MSIKVNLPMIPILDVISLSDKVLIGSSVSQGGTARLVTLLTIQAAIGSGGTSATINGDDGHQYTLVGVTVDGQITIQAVETVIGSTPGAVINGDDGHQYRLTGLVVDGQITIQAVQIS